LDATANTHFATLVNMTDTNWKTEVPCNASLGVRDAESVKDNNTVYPNPVKRGNDIHFTVTDNSEVAFYDTSGKLLKKQDLNQNNNIVNTQDLATGTYIYKITSSKNKVTSSGKIIVK
jgi:hypothetical protein